MRNCNIKKPFVPCATFSHEHSCTSPLSLINALISTRASNAWNNTSLQRGTRVKVIELWATSEQIRWLHSSPRARAWKCAIQQRTTGTSREDEKNWTGFRHRGWRSLHFASVASTLGCPPLAQIYQHEQKITWSTTPAPRSGSITSSAPGTNLSLQCLESTSNKSAVSV